MRTVLTHCGVIQDVGFLEFGEILDFYITATLTLLISSTTPSSVSLFPIPLVLSCSSLNVLSSLTSPVVGADVSPSMGRRSNHLFSDIVLYLIVRNIPRAPIQNICYTGSLQGYLVAGSEFGWSSPAIYRSRS